MVLRTVLHKVRRAREILRNKRMDKKWARIDPSSTLREAYEGFDPEKRSSRLCLFAHFDPDGRIDPYVLAHMSHLKECGFDVVLSSTSPVLDATDLECARRICRLVILRSNMGLDFVSWKVAMDKLGDAATYDRLLLTNDSIFGPFHSLSPLFSRMEEAPELVCGLTDNWEKHYHLQSFFLYFKKPIIEAKFFHTFWHDMRLYFDKEKIIEQFEVGLSRLLIRNRVQLKAIYSYYDVREVCLAQGQEFQFAAMIRSQPCNATIFMWDILLKDFDFPFLKTEILKWNRKGTKNVVFWRDFVPKFGPGGESHNLILDYLKRTVPNCPA